jgi:signal transduction histidine kinase
MDFAGLSLPQALNIQQFAQLVQYLDAYSLAIELLDHTGHVVLPHSTRTALCGTSAAPNGCGEPGCQQERQALYAAVLREGQAHARQCAGQCTLVGLPIRPFSTMLGVLLACQAPLTSPSSLAPTADSHATRPDSGDLIALLTTLLERSITGTTQQLEIDNLATELLERYEQLTFLFDLGRHVNPAEEPARMFKLVTDKIAELYGNLYVVTLFHDNAIGPLATAEPPPALSMPGLAEAAQHLCQRLAPEVYTCKRPLVLNDLRALGPQGATQTFTAILAAPILVEAQDYATLNILSLGAARPFLSSDVALVELVRKQVGIFLENHQLYRRLEAFHQSQKMEALGRLAGSIAHDFNNILSAILGYGEMTRDDLPDGSPARESLELMLNTGQHAKAMVQQILAFSRQQKQEPQAVSLAFIAREVLALLRVSMPSTIELRQDLPAMGGVILGDPTQLHQIVMNLCSNALHAMSKRGGVLEVRLAEVALDAAVAARQGLPQGTYARLTVRDTGCGMPPEVLSRIFEPFFTTKATGKGTGMGLSVVHGLVQSHGGSITVASTPGQGTTFDIFLPRLEGHPSPADTAEAPLS